MPDSQSRFSLALRERSLYRHLRCQKRLVAAAFILALNQKNSPVIMPFRPLNYLAQARLRQQTAVSKARAASPTVDVPSVDDRGKMPPSLTSYTAPPSWDVHWLCTSVMQLPSLLRHTVNTSEEVKQLRSQYESTPGRYLWAWWSDNPPSQPICATKRMSWVLACWGACLLLGSTACPVWCFYLHDP